MPAPDTPRQSPHREPAAGSPRAGPLVLIGMRGAGKSTLARAYAAAAGVRALDLDEQLEAHFGRPLAELFSAGEEPAFRAQEAALLARALAPDSRCQVSGVGCQVSDTFREVSALSTQHSALSTQSPNPAPAGIVACGAGIVERTENRVLLRGAATVFLRARAETLIRRLRAAPGARPPLTARAPDDELRHLLARRTPLYEAAAWRTLDVDDATPDALVAALADVRRTPAKNKEGVPRGTPGRDRHRTRE